MRAERVWSALQGVLCVYKPMDMSLASLKRQIIKRICVDGNDVVERPNLPIIKMPIVEPHESGSLVVVGQREQADYLSHPLVIGESFRTEDIRLDEMQYMEETSSGVCVLGVNDGCDDLPSLLAHSWVNEYRLEGVLGRETYKHEIKGRITMEANYGIILNLFENLFDYFHSNCRCFINEVGVELGTTACSVRIQRRSIGPFRAQHALLEKQITLQNIIRNISMCKKILHEGQTDSDVINEINKKHENEDIKDIFDGLGVNHDEDEFDAMRPPWPRDYT
uniref:Movement protein n=1 Tax=Heterorhabditis bacteriophora TaxID=37862 RepID=A0A1I7XFK8_HETBA